MKNTSLDYFLNNIKNNKTLYIFDWDDTLFPSTFLNKEGFLNENISLQCIPKEIINKINKIEQAIIKLFNSILNIGSFIIITNSDKKIALFLCYVYMPNVYKLICKNSFIISSKNMYMSSYPKEPILWKTKAMKYVLKNFCEKDKSKKIISIGDSIVEKIAFKTTTDLLSLPNRTIIKCSEKPSILSVYSQINKFYEYTNT